MMTIGDVLDQAAKIVETPGFWVQGELYQQCDKRVTGVCALGAICYAVWGDDLLAIGPNCESQADRDLADATEDVLDDHVKSLVSLWNDEPGRTADEVAEKMREAAADWRIEHEG